MAKKQSGLDDIFRSTDKPPAKSRQAARQGMIPAEGRTVPVGVGLKESEVEALDDIANGLGVSRNALMRYAVRYFLTEYTAGRIDLKDKVEAPRAKKRLKMP